MRVAAYVLAGDPTWLERSVRAYYPHVERVVVSYAEDDRGWTGSSLPARACAERLKALDTDGKVVLLPGVYHGGDGPPMGWDTTQRAAAVAAAGTDVDWVLQLDTDELLPDPQALLDVLAACPPETAGVEWPMRVLYRRLRDGRYLQVLTSAGTPHFEYPGWVAIRPGTPQRESRFGTGDVLRVVVAGDTTSVQLTQPLREGERRDVVVEARAAILHNSWARPPRVVWRKVLASAHRHEGHLVRYFLTTWLPSPLTWRFRRNLHPVHASVWPRLGLLPPSLQAEADRP